MKQSMGVNTPQGDSGTLSLEDRAYLFGYNSRTSEQAAVSLSMPVRSKQYESQTLHPVFQMNMPEGFMLEELRNRLSKTLQLDEMALLAISGSQAPIGRIQVDPGVVSIMPILSGMAYCDRTLIGQLRYLHHVLRACSDGHDAFPFF